MSNARSISTQRPPKTLRLNILSDPATLALVRKAAEDFAQSNGFDSNACGEIALCVNEALANVMRHAYAGATDRPIELNVEMRDNDGAIGIVIRDWGSGVNPDDIPRAPKDPLKPGGLGLICLRQMMDCVAFVPQSDGMLLEMSRKRHRR